MVEVFSFRVYGDDSSWYSAAMPGARLWCTAAGRRPLTGRAMSTRRSGAVGGGALPSGAMKESTCPSTSDITVAIRNLGGLQHQNDWDLNDLMLAVATMAATLCSRDAFFCKKSARRISEGRRVYPCCHHQTRISNKPVTERNATSLPHHLASKPLNEHRAQ